MGRTRAVRKPEAPFPQARGEALFRSSDQVDLGQRVADGSRTAMPSASAVDNKRASELSSTGERLLTLNRTES